MAMQKMPSTPKPEKKDCDADTSTNAWIVSSRVLTGGMDESFFGRCMGARRASHTQSTFVESLLAIPRNPRGSFTHTHRHTHQLTNSSKQKQSSSSEQGCRDACCAQQVAAVDDAGRSLA
eukprot:1143951-Pelagomonas_calceolata.AAC.4